MSKPYPGWIQGKILIGLYLKILDNRSSRLRQWSKLKSATCKQKSKLINHTQQTYRIKTKTQNQLIPIELFTRERITVAMYQLARSQIWSNQSLPRQVRSKLPTTRLSATKPSPRFHFGFSQKSPQQPTSRCPTVNRVGKIALLHSRIIF